MLNIYSLTSEELDERWNIYRKIQGVNLPIDVKEQEIFRYTEAIGVEINAINDDLLSERMKIELNPKEVHFRYLIYDYLWDIREDIDTTEYLSSCAEYVKDTYDLSLLNLEEKKQIVFNIQKEDYITLTQFLIDIITPGKFGFYGNSIRKLINKKFREHNNVRFPIIIDDGDVYASYRLYEAGATIIDEKYSVSKKEIQEEKKKIESLIDMR